MRALSVTLQEMPPTPSKDADVQVASQLHIPFVGYHDDSDSEANDHHVICSLIRVEILSS
jgi:hypothetical protein